MEEKYRIGRHEFNSREEWKNALRDLKTIESVVDQLDIENPKDVLVIYNMIRDGKITFVSELGAAFFCDISDRVANNTQDLLRENRKRDAELKEQEIQKKAEQSQKSSLFKTVGIICFVLAGICLAFYLYSVYSEKSAARKLEQIQEQKNISQAVDWYMARVKAKQETGTETESEEQPAEETVEEPTVLAEYSSLYARYPDLIGWIRIEDSQIDLPVMQTVDNDYYLHYNIDGEEDINGTLFLDYRADIRKPSTNLIIYGHNMKSGAMFGGLKQYLEESYTTQHDRIQFDTIYEKQEYQIIAVCLSQVGYQDDENERYYNFIDAENTDSFYAFLENVRKCAVYDKTQDVTESDHLMTLSTCNSYIEDGRLFIVAKKIQ